MADAGWTIEASPAPDVDHDERGQASAGLAFQLTVIAARSGREGAARLELPKLFLRVGGPAKKRLTA